MRPSTARKSITQISLVNTNSNNEDGTIASSASSSASSLVLKQEQNNYPSNISRDSSPDISNTNYTHNSTINDIEDEVELLLSSNIELSTRTAEFKPKLLPFIPDFIPAIGDLDPMIKVIPPKTTILDQSQSSSTLIAKDIGLSILDEPSLHSSDPASIQLQIRSTLKYSSLSSGIPSSSGGSFAPIQTLDPKKPEFSRSLAKWCQTVLDIHLKTPIDRVFYSKRMPALESLLNEWSFPLGLDSSLIHDTLVSNTTNDTNTNNTYTNDTRDVDEMWKGYRRELFDTQTMCELSVFELKQVSKMACLICDIPVYESNGNQKPLIESLHVFFSLYLEFKNNPHFTSLGTK